MKKKRALRSRVTPRKRRGGTTPWLNFEVVGDEFGPLLMYDEVSGEVWAWCVGCEHVTPLNFDFGPREQICPDCLSMLPEGR